MYASLFAVLRLRASRASGFAFPTHVKRLDDPRDPLSAELTLTSRLRDGDHVLCVPGDVIPQDGDVVSGTAVVEPDDRATAEPSAPALKAAGARVPVGAVVTAGWIVLRLCSR